MEETEILPFIHLRKFGKRPAPSLPHREDLNPPVHCEVDTSEALDICDEKTEEKAQSKKHENTTDRSRSSSSSSSEDEDAPPKPKRKPSGTVRRGLTRRGASQTQETVPENGSSSDVDTRIYTDRVKKCFMDMAKQIMPEALQDVGCVEEIEETECQEKPLGRGRGRRRGQQAEKEAAPDVIDVEAVEESVIINDDDDDEDFLGPPSPPKEIKPQQKRRAYMSKRLRTALRELNQAKRARLNDSGILEADDTVEAVEETSSSQSEEISVKVMYMGIIKKFITKRWEPFGNIIPKVAHDFATSEEGMSFFLHDRSLPSTETPNTAGLKIVDIIECHVITDKPSDEDEDEGFNIPTKDRMELFVQRRNCRRRMRIVVSKSQTLRCLMEKYAAKAKLDFTKLRFQFDGDEFGPDSTPDSLDMNSGDCIDVLV